MWNFEPNLIFEVLARLNLNEKKFLKIYHCNSEYIWKEVGGGVY